MFPDAGPLETAGNAGAGHDFGRAGARHPPFDESYLRPQRQRGGRRASNDHIRGLITPPFGEIDQYHQLLSEKAAAVRADGNPGEAFDKICLLSLYSALNLSLSTLANYNDIIR